VTAGFRLDGDRWSSAAEGGVSRPIDMSITYNAETHEVTRHPDGVVIGDDIFAVLDDLVAEDPTALWVGYLGYACRPDLRARPAVGVPDAIWMRADRTPPSPRAVTSHARAVTSHARAVSSRERTAYDAAFDEVQRRLRAGDSYEVNLTRRIELGSSDSDPEEVYAHLCSINPAPYAAHLWHDATHVLSASPESYVSIRDGRVTTKPIKGTTPRSGDPSEDAANRERLANDPRYRAENLMITDLMRNDLSQVCRPGSVEVTGLMQVESYAAVHQLVTTVEGDLNGGTTAVQAIRALFPAGSMTGAPKQRTMEIIDAIEDTPRGIYSGALGWIRGDDSELSVVIRSLIRDPAGGWQAGTGGGITVHSDAASEWDESEWKLNRLVGALG
jgi:anthranilate/para-aminobenzoate synthase component I